MSEFFGTGLDPKWSIALVLLVVIVLIAAAVWLVRLSRGSVAETPSRAPAPENARAFRRFVIRTADSLAQLLIILVTLAGGFWGSTAASLLYRLGGGSSGAETASILGFVVGAFIAFALMSILSAGLFLLIEIADNTRKTVSFFEQISTRAQPEGR